MANAPDTEAKANQSFNSLEALGDADKALLKLIVPKYGSIIFKQDERWKLNELALVAWFAAAHKVRSRLSDGALLQYTSEGNWQKIETARVKELMAQMLKDKLADVVRSPDLLAKRTIGLLKNLLMMIEIVSVLGEPPSPAQALLPVNNGVLDLSGAKPVLRPYREEDWFTTKLPWSYEPEAKCDRFLNELIRPALPDEDDIRLLQRDLGRQLFAGNDAQTISVLVGEGGSGKSVLLLILEAMLLHEKIGHLRSDQLNGRFETHGFHGKTTLVGKDVRPDYLNNQGAAVIKSLTGADRIQTEKKYGGKHDLRGSFYVIITANSRLLIKLQRDASAWRRRLVVYEFSRKAPDKRISNFDHVLLKEEGAAILNWLICGFLAHREELREHGTLKLTPAQQQRVDDWLQESDALRSFANENIQAGIGTLTVDESWTAYCEFARARNWRIPRKQRFQEDFPEVMFELFGVERDNHIRRFGAELRGYKGVHLIHKND